MCPEQRISDYDLGNVGEIIAGRGDWFSAQLVRLMVKADPIRSALLANAFPEHALAVEAWRWGRDPVGAVEYRRELEARA